MAEFRVQVPGGGLTVQDLRDLVGWAGAAGAAEFRMGDAQDFLVELNAAPGPVPARFRAGPQGSVQSSAYCEAPTAALPWLTQGVWMDLLAEVPDPGALDVQILHDAARSQFLRHGHVRFLALKAPHQWEVQLRRPGTDRLVLAPPTSTGDLARRILQVRQAWDQGDAGPWQSSQPPSARFPQTLGSNEGFHRESSTFHFGWAPASGRVSVHRLRDLAWLASDTGASRAWLTPDRTLVFEGIPLSRKPDWQEWLVKNRLPTTHGELDRSVRAAGWSLAAWETRVEVLGYLAQRDQMPPFRALLVADDGLNRADGVCCQPFPLVIRTASSWLFRSGDGRVSGEGTLSEVLEALEKPPVAGPLAGPLSEGCQEAADEGRTCPDCLTVYDPRYGDPLGGIVLGVAFDQLPGHWACPVCGLPKGEWPTEAPASSLPSS